MNYFIISREQLRKCPSCAERVKVDARKCKYCSEELSEVTAKDLHETEEDYISRMKLLNPRFKSLEEKEMLGKRPQNFGRKRLSHKTNRNGLIHTLSRSGIFLGEIVSMVIPIYPTKNIKLAFYALKLR